jgi:acyl-CoA thioesterase-1
MRRLAATLVLALALGLPRPGDAQPRAEPAGCSAPPEAMEAAPLPGAFAAIARDNLRIMVVGSASTMNGGTSGLEAVWPQRLEAILGARLAPVGVQVKSFGGRGTTAADHARILAAEAPRFRPHLIIWQLGTVEAARGLPADEMADAVQEAAARLRAQRGELTDLVLMDQQFSRFFRANADVELYRDKLRIAATASGAQLFSRWAVMKHWAETGRLDLERAPRESRTATADELHDCLARALASFILEGTQRERR